MEHLYFPFFKQLNKDQSVPLEHKKAWSVIPMVFDWSTKIDLCSVHFPVNFLFDLLTSQPAEK